jgi:hypothetical protein
MISLYPPMCPTQLLPSKPSERGARGLSFTMYTRLTRFRAQFGAYAFVDDEDPLEDAVHPEQPL